MTDDVKLTSHEFALAFEEFYAAFFRFEAEAMREDRRTGPHSEALAESLEVAKIALRRSIERDGGINAEATTCCLETMATTLLGIGTALSAKWGVR